MQMRVTSRVVDKKLQGNNNSVIDSGFRGEWQIIITNTNDYSIYIVKDNSNNDESDFKYTYSYNKGICQAVLLPVPKTKIEEISYEELQNIDSERGLGMLGSTNQSNDKGWSTNPNYDNSVEGYSQHNHKRCVPDGVQPKSEITDIIGKVTPKDNVIDHNKSSHGYVTLTGVEVDDFAKAMHHINLHTNKYNHTPKKENGDHNV